MAPFKSSRTKTCRCAVPSFLGRPGEKRTFRAFSPPRRRALRQRITELGEHSIRRPTSLSDRPSSKSAKARRRLSSNNSADPRGLITNLLEVNHSILYAALFNSLPSALPGPRISATPWRHQRFNLSAQFPRRLHEETLLNPVGFAVPLRGRDCFGGWRPHPEFHESADHHLAGARLLYFAAFRAHGAHRQRSHRAVYPSGPVPGVRLAEPQLSAAG